MYYSYKEIEYVATSFSPARTDLALKLLNPSIYGSLSYVLQTAAHPDIRKDLESADILGLHPLSGPKIDDELTRQLLTNEALTSQEKQDVFAENAVSPSKAMLKETAPIPQNSYGT
jgi:hypothetical protein